MASTASDSVTAGRARMLAETAGRYREIATRRDGQSIIQTSATVPLGPAASGFTNQALPNRISTPGPQVSPTPPSLMVAPSATARNHSLQAPASPPSTFQRRAVSTAAIPVPTIPVPAIQRGAAPMAGDPRGSDRGNGVMQHSGYLVQVYSARSNSPPFALTDTTGRTVAYVTPSPGVNLRTHLNSRINVVGTRGFLTGLNTPHILVTQAVRTPE
jgi:hypothetical protein